MQYITKIPPAVTEAERVDDILVAYSMGRCTVVHLPTRQVVANGVSSREAVEATWIHSGSDYVLRPRMEEPVDENTGVKARQQQAVGVFGPEWDVYFKTGVAEPWHRSGLTAYGVTEREAMLALFDDAFRRRAWLPEYEVTVSFDTRHD